MPAISVIVPVYGVEPYIEACLKSIAAQTFQDFELILVDDACLDRSIEIAKRFLTQTDLSWRVICQENQGQGAARDHGIREARGDYVICIDSDDTVAPDFLEILYTAAEKHGCDVCFSNFEMVSSPKTGNVCAAPPVFLEISRESMLSAFLCRTVIPILPAMLIRRAMILEKNLSAYPGCRFSEDVLFMWLLFASSEKIAYTQKSLYYYLRREGSTMTASSAGRIITGYKAFQALEHDLRFDVSFPGREYLLSRWVLGALRSSAKISDISVFLSLARQMDYRAHAAAMRNFPEKKARILGAILYLNPRIFYSVIRLAG